MFIKFNHLKFKNISSYGNNLTIFDFHKGFHLLSAPNGSGKCLEKFTEIEILIEDEEIERKFKENKNLS